jgi:ribosome-associated translation inhibitor RaiA
MKTKVHFRNIDGLDHIRKFVGDSVEQSIGRFDSNRQFDGHVVLGMVSGRSETHRPVFECELLINGKGLSRPVVVKKHNSNFHHAIRDCLKTSAKILRRASKIRVLERRSLRFQPLSALGSA